MKRDGDKRSDAGSKTLRRQAEERLKNRRAGADLNADADLQRLIHDLGVHQIELEIQNEELQSARLETEDALARYTELFDFAPIGYATLDVQGGILQVNHAAGQILRRERSRLTGRPFADYVTVDHRDAVKRLLAAATDVAGAHACEARILTLNGEWVEVRLTAARSESGILLLAIVDITLVKKRERELANAQAVLRAIDRRKDEFLAVLSHELRNPLAPIKNSLFVLERAAPGSERARNAQAIIDRQVSHLTRLVDDMLDVTRITQGKIHLNLEPVELGELLRRALADHRVSFEAHGINLREKIGAGPFWVDGDADRLTQAFSNVLGNAEKFTPRGGEVVVSLECFGGSAVARVSDSGAGIAPDVLPHVFEIFQQAPQTIDRSRGGLGLGLPTVKGLIDLHHGQVSIASEGPGHGTELTIQLPVREAPKVAPTVEAPPETPPRRVLVIEDNVDSAESLKDALVYWGHEVQVAFDGPSGLAAAPAFRPDVVICDIGLPGMDGYDVARAFRADPRSRGVQLVALSGYTQAADLEKASAAGFVRHLAKPVRLDTLDRLFAELTVPG